MHGGLLLQVIHVAGERMKLQGTNGLYRGELSIGVLAGKAMITFVTLHLSALERQPQILEWVRSWTGIRDLEALTPED